MKSNMYKKAIQFMLFFLVPILLFYLLEAYEHNAFVEVRPLAQLYNVFLFELIAWILFFVLGNAARSIRVLTVITFVYGLVNHYVMEFRSTPFVPWDIFSIKTATSVAENYDFTPTIEVVLVTAALIVIFVLAKFISIQAPQKVLWRILPMGCVVFILVGFVQLLWDKSFQTSSYLYPHLFTPAYMTKVNGMAVTFSMNLAYVYVERPEGYSVEKAKEILENYENDTNKAENIMLNGVQTSDLSDLPNIIVIMNEAFSDLSILGDFTTNEDYMPFIHSLQNGAENTITGNLTVSVCGGNTANTEFEFLTGHTMDYFPVGSIPYQQYINGEIPSLASQLREIGYVTYGVHPYNASGWKRDEIYPLLGLDTNYFLRDFTNRYYIREYVSDQTAYEKIIDIYEKKEEGKPIFLFEVTMQNHGGYTETHENFIEDIYVEEFESPALNQYLSLIKVSDEELEQLMNYFKYEEEKTILLFFGDHQPNDSVVRSIYRWNGVNMSDMTADEAQMRYIVPYVMWANYDIAEEINADTDISFLGAHLLENADICVNAYQRFLLEMEQVLENEDASEEVKEEYQQMSKILQYYLMFDYQEEE